MDSDYRYNLFAGVKGGFTWFGPRRIFITTNIHPRFWYDYSTREAQYIALQRRVRKVVWWKRLDGPITNLRRGHGRSRLQFTRAWNHFWDGPSVPTLRLENGNAVIGSAAPTDRFDW